MNDVWINEEMNERIHGWKNTWMDVWTMNEWVN